MDSDKEALGKYLGMAVKLKFLLGLTKGGVLGTTT